MVQVCNTLVSREVLLRQLSQGISVPAAHLSILNSIAVSASEVDYHPSLPLAHLLKPRQQCRRRPQRLLCSRLRQVREDAVLFSLVIQALLPALLPLSLALLFLAIMEAVARVAPDQDRQINGRLAPRVFWDPQRWWKMMTRLSFRRMGGEALHRLVLVLASVLVPSAAVLVLLGKVGDLRAQGVLLEKTEHHGVLLALLLALVLLDHLGHRHLLDL